MSSSAPSPPDLHVEVHPGRGPHALLVHGMLSSRAQWQPNLDALSAVCRPVVVELLGHGRSPAPTGDRPYLPESYVEAFEAIRSALGVERWVLIGQSLGGALTMRYALDLPHRVLGHVFTNSASALGDERWQAGVAKDIPVLAQRIDDGGDEAVAALPQHPARARRLPPELHRALLDDAELLDPAGVAATLRHTIPRSSCRARAGTNVVPTLLVAGVRERGFAGPLRYARAAIPHLTVVEADAGHAPNLHTPQLFNDAVAAFVEQHGQEAQLRGT